METTEQGANATATPAKNVAYFVTERGLSFFLDHRPFVVPNTHRNFEKVKRALAQAEYDLIPRLLSEGDEIKQRLVPVLTEAKKLGVQGDFSVNGKLIYLDSRPFTAAVSQKVLRTAEEGFNVEPVLAFLRKVRENPSQTAQDELLLFCEANEFLTHIDGDLIAYKGVRHDYLDSYSGTVLNKLASAMTDEERATLPSSTIAGVTVSIENGLTVVSMARDAVNPSRSQTCSYGLHFAAHNYAYTQYARGDGHLMVLKINPRDVVAIPSDYNNQKGRCCRYEIMEEIVPEPIKEVGLPHREIYTDEDIARGAVGELAAHDTSVAVVSPNAARLREVVASTLNIAYETVKLHNDLDDLGVRDQYDVQRVYDAIRTKFDVQFPRGVYGQFDLLSTILRVIDEQAPAQEPEEIEPPASELDEEDDFDDSYEGNTDIGDDFAGPDDDLDVEESVEWGSEVLDDWNDDEQDLSAAHDDAEAKAEASREMKRERDRRYRANKKKKLAAKKATKKKNVAKKIVKNPTRAEQNLAKFLASKKGSKKKNGAKRRR